MTEDSTGPQTTSRLREIIENELKREDKTLCLSYLDLPNEEWEEMPDILQEHHFTVKEIRACDFGGNNFGKIIAQSPNGANFLTHSLIHFHNLRELDLRDNKLFSDGIKKILKVLDFTCVESLEELDISENMIRDSGVAALAQTSLPYVRKLNLISNFITPKGIDALGTFITLNEDRLESLHLDNNPLGNAGVQLLTEIFLHNPCALKQLTLGDCLLADAGCRDLGKFLRSKSCMLQSLNLSVNHIGAEGLRVLLRSIPKCLRHIDLGGNSFGDPGVMHLAQYAPLLPSIQEIDITCVGMTDASAPHLLNALVASKEKIALRDLSIDGNEVSDTIGVRLVEWSDQKDLVPVQDAKCTRVKRCMRYAKFSMLDSVNDMCDWIIDHDGLCLVSLASAGLLWKVWKRWNQNTD